MKKYGKSYNVKKLTTGHNIYKSGGANEPAKEGEIDKFNRGYKNRGAASPVPVLQLPKSQSSCKPVRCTGISDYLPIDSEGRIYAVQVFTTTWSSGRTVTTNWIGGPDGSEGGLVQIPDDRGTFGAGIPFGINDTREDQSSHPPGIYYSMGSNATVKSSYVILKDDDVHDVPSPYSEELGEDQVGIPSVAGFCDGLAAFGLLHRIGVSVSFGTIIVPPGWQVDVWSMPNYSCSNQFSNIRGPFMFYEPQLGFSPSPGPLPDSIKQLYASKEGCSTWDQMVNFKSIPVNGLRDSNCFNGCTSYGSLDQWTHNAAHYCSGQDGRNGVGGYSFKLTKIPMDDRSGNYKQLGVGRFEYSLTSN